MPIYTTTSLKIFSTGKGEGGEAMPFPLASSVELSTLYKFAMSQYTCSYEQFKNLLSLFILLIKRKWVPYLQFLIACVTVYLRPTQLGSLAVCMYSNKMASKLSRLYKAQLHKYLY